MEDQPPLPPNQTSENPSNDSQAIQQGLANTPYPQNTQPLVTAPQAPAPVNIPGEPSLPPRSYGKNRRLVMVIGILALLLLAIAGISIFGHRSHHVTISPNNSINTSNTPPAKAATSDTPLAETAHGSSDAAGLAISIARVLPNPPVTGDPPDAGTQYVEIDLAVANNAKHTTIVPGTFYYQTAGGSLLNTADTIGNKPGYPNKNVQIPDEEPLARLSLKAGQSNTDTLDYLIYQVPPTDKGKLVWFQGYYDPTSTKFAIFDLY